MLGISQFYVDTIDSGFGTRKCCVLSYESHHIPHGIESRQYAHLGCALNILYI